MNGEKQKCFALRHHQTSIGRTLILVCLFALLRGLKMEAATYYVDSSGGNDTNNGTNTATAWQSLTKVNATTFSAGDSILFKAGGTWVGSLNPKGSGTAGNPIIIDRYDTGSKPLINGNGVSGTGTTGGGAVYLYNQEYWEINNLEVVNDAASDAERRGIHIAAANYGTVDHIYIRNCYVHNIRGRISTGDGDLVAKRTGGIIVEVTDDTPTPTRFNDILIENNTIATVRNQGIVAANNRNSASDFPGTSAWLARKVSNLVIRGNSISDVSKNALILRLADATCLVEYNVCYNTATLDTGNTMFTAACDGAVFQFNEGYNNLAGPIRDGSLYDADLRSLNITFQYSYSHDNSHGLFWQYPSAEGANDNTVCRYNISRADQGIIFAFSGDAGATSTNSIYNNTIYTPANLSPVFFDHRSATHTYYVYNNIFYNLSSTASYSFGGSDVATFDYNVFYGQHVAGEPNDAHKLTSDPLLVYPGSGGNGINSLNGYKLQAGSPCIDSGMTIANHGGRDYFGNAVPQNGATDRGAHEFTSGEATNVPPGITTPPQGLTVVSGSSVNFSVTATGTAPLAHQWRKDGGAIGGATGTNLSFAAVLTGDSGSYDVVVTNAYGAVTSAPAILTVTNAPPTITEPPQDLTVVSGGSANFSVTAAGMAPLAYQWRKGGVGIDGATGTNLFFAAVTTNDAGSYEVLVTNMAGAITSSPATLTVTVPSANGGLLIAEVYNGGGKTGATYRNDYVLLKNVTAATVSVTNWSLQHDKAGVWQPPFILTNLTLPAGGYYLVQCYNDGGTANGVALAPDATTPQTNTWNFSTGTAGAVALVSDTNPVTGCTAATIVDLVGWVSTAGNCYEGSGVITAGSATQSNQRRENGCQDTDSNPNDFVTNTPTGLNSATNPAPCSSCYPPLIAGNPSNATVTVGAGASLAVTASGTALAYQWRKDGVAVDGATGSTLTFDPATTNDAGGFDVVVSNACGAVTSSVATLTVTEDPPLFTSALLSVNVAPGDTVTFSISATGSLPLSYQWRKNSTPIDGATNTALTISNVTSSDAADYDVIVTNAFGLDVSTPATLSIVAADQPPGITSQPASQTVSAGANVTFGVSASGTAPLAYQWRRNNSPIANATDPVLVLSSVTTNDAGGYSVVVTNLFGSATSAVATLNVAAAGTNFYNVNPADFINPRFPVAVVTSGVKFADVVNYKGVATSLYLDVYQPYGDTNNNRPVIVWIHGGGFRTGSSRTQSYIVTYATEFAKRGYVCLSIDYRLRNAADMPTQESELPAEQDAASDCNTAFEWVRSHAATYGINTNWMFVGGGSAGGRTAAVFSFHEGPDTNVCAGCTSAVLTNGVNLVPPVNWNRKGVIANADLWGSPEPVMRWYTLDASDVPTVIIHGTADTTIPYQNSLDLYDGLVAAGVTVELNPLPGLGHTPTSADSQIIPWVANFFAREWTQKLNKAPAAASDRAATARRTPVTIKPLLNDTDADGDSLTISSVTPANGTADILDGTNVVFTPASNFVGSATINYVISDGFGGSAGGLITVDVTNRPPVAANETVGTYLNKAVTINPLLNDTDGDGDSLAISGLYPANGTATVVNGTNVLFTPATNFAGIASVSYVMSDGFGGSAGALILVNVTNRYMGTAGKYYGLFCDTNNGAAHPSAGFFKLAMLVPARRLATFSGYLLVEGQKHPFAGAFDTDGNGATTQPVVRPGKSSLAVSLQLDFDSAGVVGGSVSNLDGSWTAQLAGDRAVFNKTNPAVNYVGSYTLVLPGNGVPGGDGYATMRIISNGTIKVTGLLGDAQPLKPAATVVSRHGDWAFYAPAYLWTSGGSPGGLRQYAGEIMGWLNISNDTGRHIVGDLTWIKTGWTNGYYDAGFTNPVTVLGGGYTFDTNRLVAITNGSLVLGGGNLTGEYTNSFVLNPGNKFVVTNTPYGQLAGNTLRVTPTPKTGLVKATFRNPDNPGLVTTASGVVLQEAAVARGVFKGLTNQTGFLLLQGD